MDHKRERYNTVHCIKLTNKMFQEFQTFGGCCFDQASCKLSLILRSLKIAEFLHDDEIGQVCQTSCTAIKS